jgi:cobaltochelatase CobN
VLPPAQSLRRRPARGADPHRLEIGRRTAEEVVGRHVQDHGEWPRAIVLDLVGLGDMRTAATISPMPSR